MAERKNRDMLVIATKYISPSSCQIFNMLTTHPDIPQTIVATRSAKARRSTTPATTEKTCTCPSSLLSRSSRPTTLTFCMSTGG